MAAAYLRRKEGFPVAYIKRDLEEKILSLSEEYSAILITGPRQVGKTTVLRQLMGQDRAYVTLDDLEERAMAKKDPGLFLQVYITVKMYPCSGGTDTGSPEL